MPAMKDLTLSILFALGLATALPTRAEVDYSPTDQWIAYARQNITPSFAWAHGEAFAEPTVLGGIISRSAARGSYQSALAPDGMPLLRFSVDQRDVSNYLSMPLVGKSQRLDAGIPGLRQSIFSPTLLNRLSDGNTLSVSLMMVQQQFASWGFGSGLSPQPTADDASFSERTYGSGVRLDFSRDLGDAWAIGLDYRSKVRMDAFQSYRGVYTEPGDFDLPEAYSWTLDRKISPSMTLSLGAHRVIYNDINAFTSAALPTRFLALLGDGSSPEFKWQDLTIYSLDWSWRASNRDLFALRYATQQQPVPSSEILRAALFDEFTDQNYSFSYQRTSGGGIFSLIATYAPESYFLGNFSASNRNQLGKQLELEAVWSVPF